MKKRSMFLVGLCGEVWLSAVLLIAILSMPSCSPDESEVSDSRADSPTEARRQETARMAAELAKLDKTGNPTENYHWNARRAALLKKELASAPPERRDKVWFNYCYQSLLAGDTDTCINEIRKRIEGLGATPKEALNQETAPLFELLALAYLRKGEQENCQENHTAESCIVPLRKGGFYTLKEGPRKAIKAYKLLLDKFPHPRYAWLMNLAYMTLGKYPEGVPRRFKLPVPNGKLEQPNFPAFKDIAMEMGLAINGLSGGTCIDDFNNDGHLDIFMTSYGMTDNVRLFLSDQKGGYVEKTEAAGLKGIVSGLNCLHADYDNDGNKDILVLRGAWLGVGGKHPNSLLRNMGDGTFADVTRSAGLLSYHPTQTATWGDFNRDGFLDLFIGNETLGKSVHACELFRNNGDGTFTEVTTESGVGRITAYVKGCAFGDVNNDGWPELYVSVMGGKNLLFRNQEGKFEEIGERAGVARHLFSFPCWFWDVNNDGHDDLFVGSYDMRTQNDVAGDYARELMGLPIKTQKPALYMNNGDETFREASREYGINRTMYAMGSNFGDLDNDGFLDFYIGTGTPDLTSIVPNRMFRNVKGERFEEVTSAGRFGHIQKGHGIAFADLDRDGDQDIYAVMGGAMEGDTFTNILFENPLKGNNWIVIELEGTRTNRAAIGTRLELELEDGRKIFSRVNSGGSFGASSLQQELGMGQAKSVKKLTVIWQNSPPQTFLGLKANQMVKLTEGAEKVVIVPYAPTPFRKMTGKHKHH